MDRRLNLLRLLLVLTPIVSTTWAHRLPILGDDDVWPPISPEEFARAIADPSIRKRRPKDANATDNFWDADDIILSPEEQRKHRTSGIVRLWENGLIPYSLSKSISSEDRQVIAAAMADFHKYTCLKFVGRSSENDYVSIKSGDDTCNSRVGRIGGSQDLHFPDFCFDTFGTVIHELMHATGFYHEHNRPDRNSYVDIHWNDIEGGTGNVNYILKNPWPENDLRMQYDYKSVMHYNTRKMTPKKAPDGVTIGQREGFSPLDICGVNALYGCSSSLYIAWPAGTYGIPKRNAGLTSCPCGWVEGFRFQDSEDGNIFNKNANSWSTLHISGSIGHRGIKQEFCIKNVDDRDEGTAWPAGDYCIYQYGSCPVGFSYGWIFQDDEDILNDNSHGGYLPSGIYDHNTLYRYCCRNDGSSSTAIQLPTARDFYLFPYKSECQKVSGKTATEEWLYMDDEDDNTNSRGGTYPKGDYGRNTKIYYCYYHN